ncbi:GNAT family N-acetyltransferase [Rhodophyticola porphyridii]|uniref:GNAT family N-acetyltransferase n=1 Tax=Rhodophyticola porphyridii TaxID=1852017 RepID=UPI0035D0DA49
MTIELKTSAKKSAPHGSGFQETELLTVLAAAFEADPPVRWLYPELSAYQTHFPDFARAFGGAAFARNTHQARDGGAALWIPPGGGPSEGAIEAVIENSIPAERHSSVFSVFEAMEAFHIEEPHWYLPLMGVVPERQGQGLGSALLRPVLELCDADRVPAYLEATTVRSRALYLRHGFESLGTIDVGGCPAIHPMLRKPK